jgi:ATP-dependent helicase HrpB
VIHATTLAATPIPVPDVTAGEARGLPKGARVDGARGSDSLETERVSEVSAAQRAGRAGRLGPGRVIRLWDARDRLRPHREPEVARVDLASTLLDVIAWGGDPRTFAWYDAPPAHAVDAALLLLRRLEAIDEAGALLAAGSLMRQMSVHPRLARLLITAGATSEAARACALLSERRGAPAPPEGATNCDLLAAIERPLPSHVSHVARELERAATSVLGREHRAPHDEARFRRAVLSGYPDRVAWRREEKGDRLLLATGAISGSTTSRATCSTRPRLSRSAGVAAVARTCRRGRPPAASALGEHGHQGSRRVRDAVCRGAGRVGHHRHHPGEDPACLCRPWGHREADGRGRR